ncbi:MAG: hypothetical protein KBD01_10605 [Acidobacteria bacterium]|nr:hypothetical protein [Acidobacteriota bacterium]
MFPAPASRPAALALAALVLAGAGCRAAPEQPRAEPTAAPPAAEAVPVPAAAADQPAAPSAPALPHIAWPSGWRVVAAGGCGAAGTRMYWARLEARAAAPEPAVRAGLAALRGLAGPDPDQDVSVAPDGSSAVAQLRGARLSGSVLARTSGALTEIRVVLQE